MVFRKTSSRLAAKALPHIPKEKGKAPGPHKSSTGATNSGPGACPVPMSPALWPRLTLQVANPGLRAELQQSPHEEL